MYKVYMWINTVNGKRYIGTTRDSMEKRAGKNGYHYSGSPRFYAAIQLHGFDAFKCCILEDGLTKQEAAEAEKRYIKMYGTMNPDIGYNLQEGGFPTDEMDPTERAAKISRTLKEERSSVEYRQLMRERMKKVWDDPKRRAELMRKRAATGKTGMRSISVYCKELDTVYPHMKACAKALNLHSSRICTGLKNGNGKFLLHSRKNKRTYTIMLESVHIKESELLGTSAGNAGGNQQPSLEEQWDVQPNLGF